MKKPTDNTLIAELFVDLLDSHRQAWTNNTELPRHEMQILFEVVATAGFNPKMIILGRLVDEGNFTINRFCPFKVIDQKGKDDYLATGWLDCMFTRALRNQRTEDRAQIIEVVKAEIERSIPLEPIQLTEQGDHLCEYPPSVRTFGPKYLISHTRDTSEIGSCVGVHEHCDGWVDRREATALHDALVCRACSMRILFPKDVKTYGDLRKSLEQQLLNPEFPKYLMKINGQRQFLPLDKAAAAYDSGHDQVSFGRYVLNADFSVGLMEEADRKRVSDAAGEYSGSK